MKQLEDLDTSVFITHKRNQLLNKIKEHFPRLKTQQDTPNYLGCIIRGIYKGKLNNSNFLAEDFYGHLQYHNSFETAPHGTKEDIIDGYTKQDIEQGYISILKEMNLPLKTNTQMELIDTFNDNTEHFLEEYSDELFKKIRKDFPDLKMPTTQYWLKNTIKDIYQGKIKTKQEIKTTIEKEISFTYTKLKVIENFKDKLYTLLCHSLKEIKKEIKKREYSLLDSNSLNQIFKEQKAELTKTLQTKLYRSNLYRSPETEAYRKEIIDNDIQTIVDNISQTEIINMEDFLEQQDISIATNEKSKKNIIKLLQEANKDLVFLQQTITQLEHPMSYKLKKLCRKILSALSSLFIS